jgi:DNA-binding transcriptional MerR regulator
MATADDHRTYSIRQLCREFGATARALRFYEDKGLLTPARKGQTRVYDARDRARLKLILRGKRFGFSLEQIRQVLDLHDRQSGDEAQIALACQIARERLDQMERERAALDVAIEELKGQLAWGQEVLSTLRPGSVAA